MNTPTPKTVERKPELRDRQYTTGKMGDAGYVQEATRSSNPQVTSATSKAKITKSVEYAYPSSISATKFGYADKGCWCYETCSGVKPPKAIKGFANKSEAMKYAETQPEPWNETWLRFNKTTTKSLQSLI